MCRLFQLAGLLMAGSLVLADVGQPPNILLIAVDDMGYDTPASFGGRVEGLTPHIDSLASQGMSFTRAYNTSSRCAPSRGSIMTGHYQDNYNVQRGGSAQEVAETVLWLLSEQASYVTGSLLDVTGGR